MTEPQDAEHPVYPGGPPCGPHCPGEWSNYHDGYADGYENAEAAALVRTPETLTFRTVAATNAARCNRWHHGFPGGDDAWTGADWSNAMQGEAGEAGNVVKKLRRIDLDLWGNRKEGDADRSALVARLADEIADTFIYLDLLATFYGVDLAAAVVSKFNRISEEAGFPERLP